jgi:hypothetical protein
MTLADEELTVGVAGSEKWKTARKTGKKIAKVALKNVGNIINVFTSKGQARDSSPFFNFRRWLTNF